MILRSTRLRALASVGSVALLCAGLAPSSVQAGTVQSTTISFNIPAGPLAQSLLELGRQAGISIAAPQDMTAGLRGNAVSGQLSTDEALRRLLSGTGLRAEFISPNAVRIVRNTSTGNTGPQSENDDATAVADIIVTAQKREQSIQDVPIAVSAFSADNLDAMKIEGGSELLRAIPNVAFSKNNFSMYNISIRGIGTKAVSASSDPAVAISFNNSPTLRNRLFESEYLDVSRVEVLRGPQGTLYGRNATAGVINMIPNLPGPNFDALLKAEAGNYGSTRGQMMINIPLAENFWVRGAASLTKRDGFDYNTFLDTEVNGRDLYSTRLSALWQPSDRLSANLIWEHFAEDDNRSRTGKQLCTPDPGPSSVRSATVPENLVYRLTQGCQAKTLYDDAAYGIPDLRSMPQYEMAQIISWGYDPVREKLQNALLHNSKPSEGIVQSRNLREIESLYNPTYTTTNDVIQLNIDYSISDTLTLYSQTLYTNDNYRSTQDYNRFVTHPIFGDSSNNLNQFAEPIGYNPVMANGIFVDPQLGASDRIMSVDMSQSKNKQFYQELRLQSNRDGNFNYSIGANYLKFESLDDYYVFNNLFTLIAQYVYNDIYEDITYKRMTNNCSTPDVRECVYVDLSPLNDLVGDGHNYFRSINDVSTESWAVFGEGYWNLKDDLRLTIGLRYTDDTKLNTPYPSQLLLGSSSEFDYGPVTGGTIVRGHRALPDIKLSWQAFTGRALIDWKPSEDVMLYASYSRGYKGGGTNPPRADLSPAVVQYQPLPEIFEPEYVNAFEIGAKTSLFNNNLRLNATAFYYDYTDYQVSQIVDRISLNENFNAESMGLEIEAIYNPTPSFRLDATLGLLKTRIGDGEGSIDVMNRTQGNEDWTVIRPWMQVPSNCIAPTSHVETILNTPFISNFGFNMLAALCAGSARVGSYDPTFETNWPWWMFTGIEYNPLTDAPNFGRGFNADLSGNELPNAPRWTANIGAQYTWFIGNSELTLRGDYYRQADSYFRVYNTEYDQIRGWDNLNLAVTWEMPQSNTTIQAYVKNVFDDAPIVDAFTNSDDSMLTTNVFTLDPRVWGISLTKRF